LGLVIEVAAAGVVIKSPDNTLAIGGTSTAPTVDVQTDSGNSGALSNDCNGITRIIAAPGNPSMMGLGSAAYGSPLNIVPQRTGRIEVHVTIEDTHGAGADLDSLALVAGDTSVVAAPNPDDAYPVAGSILITEFQNMTIPAGGREVTAFIPYPTGWPLGHTIWVDVTFQNSGVAATLTTRDTWIRETAWVP